ncbi:hypothetical protein MTR67_052678 [Solanum verrucosum]|uniref:RRM domain-containing protein n=1 Tax=Solanum verrucosum TaxID=315347 RepID=A0AAF0V9K7_SOLVR|nr:hypothetical protein MTR67_052678 [Solanum verrucosum]
MYVGNINPQVTKLLVQEVFSSTRGPLEGYNLIRKDKSSYGFVDYFDRRSAALAIVSLNGRQLFGQCIEATDTTLFVCFSVYMTSCSDARVMWEQKDYGCNACIATIILYESMSTSVAVLNQCLRSQHHIV